MNYYQSNNGYGKRLGGGPGFRGNLVNRNLNAIGNIGSATNPLMVGWLNDLTGTFNSGLLVSAAMLVLGAITVLFLPIPRLIKSKAAV